MHSASIQILGAQRTPMPCAGWLSIC